MGISLNRKFNRATLPSPRVQTRTVRIQIEIRDDVSAKKLITGFHIRERKAR